MAWTLLRATCAGDLESAFDVLERSAGPVTKPHLFTDRPYGGGPPRVLRPEKDGPRCERIFGPVRDHRCSCSKYRGVEHAGTRCEKCGVEVLGLEARATRWAHVELASPVFHPAAAEVVAARLGLSAAEVCDVARFEAWLDDGRCQSPTDDEPYEGLNPYVIEYVARSGPLALEAALVDAASSDEGAPGDGAMAAFVRLLPIPPPAERPLRLHNGELFAGAVDLALSALLATNQHIILMREGNVPAAFIATEQQRLQSRFESLLAVAAEQAPAVRLDGKENARAAECLPVPPDLEFAPDCAQELWWPGENLLLRSSGVLSELSSRGEVVRRTDCVVPGGTIAGLSHDGRFVAFDQDGAGQCVLDCASGEWLGGWPDELHAWSYRGTDGQHWWWLVDSRTGTMSWVEADMYGHRTGVGSSCGRFVWTGRTVYAVGDGRECARPGHWSEYDDSIRVVRRDGTQERLDLDTFEEQYDDVADETGERLREVQSGGRALAQTREGFVVLESNVVAGIEGPRVFVAFPYDAAAFCPGGTQLALLDGSALVVIDLESLALREFPIEMRADV